VGGQSICRGIGGGRVSSYRTFWSVTRRTRRCGRECQSVSTLFVMPCEARGSLSVQDRMHPSAIDLQCFVRGLAHLFYAQLATAWPSYDSAKNTRRPTSSHRQADRAASTNGPDLSSACPRFVKRCIHMPSQGDLGNQNDVSLVEDSVIPVPPQVSVVASHPSQRTCRLASLFARVIKRRKLRRTISQHIIQRGIQSVPQLS
jgi:hypothetical protein